MEYLKYTGESREVNRWVAPNVFASRWVGVPELVAACYRNGLKFSILLTFAGWGDFNERVGSADSDNFEDEGADRLHTRNFVVLIVNREEMMRSITPQRSGITLLLVLLGMCDLAVGQGYTQPAQPRYAPPQATNQRAGLANRQIESGRTVSAPVYQVDPNANGPRRSGVVPASYVPQHQRMAQNEGAMPGGSIMNQAPATAPSAGMMGAPIMGDHGPGDCASCGEAVGTNYFGHEAVLGCDSCGESQAWGCDQGGCPPGLIGDCWINSLGALFYKAEYFAGAQGFTAPAFQIPGTNSLNRDSSFGFNAGVNVGIPLCRITCGLLSGQVGVRTVNSEFSGTPFAADNRDQLFLTTGLYRRVDAGLQFGVVGDFLYEKWYTDTTVIQLRGDLGWVYVGGNTLGFRAAKNVQDDVTDGVYNGLPFNSMITSSIDNYRFYYRQMASMGGYSDIFLGWSESNHFVGGLEYDIPVGERWALQSSFTYLMPEDEDETGSTGGNSNEAWNVAVGFVFRPQGRCWYTNYDRPILPVADNGSMIPQRGF